MNQITRIFDLVSHYPGGDTSHTVFATPVPGGWEPVTLETYQLHTKNLARAFMTLLDAGDRIATITNNRPEWNYVDQAAGMAGMVHVPIYPTLSDEDFRYILVHSGVRLLFISDQQVFQKLSPLAAEIHDIIGVFSFDHVEGCNDWRTFISLHQSATSAEMLQQRMNSIQPDRFFTLIYTSGSTGRPKGVMLSHQNILSNLKAVADIFPMDFGDRALSILPLCHITERMVNYVYQYTGVKIYYARGWSTLLKDLHDSKAHGFVAVPRVLEKILEKIAENMQSLSWAKRWGVRRALKLAASWEQSAGKKQMRRLAVADRKIFSHWRQALGGPKKFIACGGAHLSEKILRIFLAAGFPVHEGYGMTETSPLISINHFTTPNDMRPGTQGKPLKEVQVRISDEGEILVKGPNLMLGYFKEDETTKSAFDPDGWFHTGDLGNLTDEGFLRVTGRKKELFKTSGGKYIAPLRIEQVFLRSPLIDNMIVVGENEKFPGAIIQPNFDFLTSWAGNHRIRFLSFRDLVRKKKIIQIYKKEISKLNRQLSKPEQIKDFRLVKDEWAIPTGELSATLKVRRMFVQNKYDKLTRSIYRPKKNRRVIKTKNPGQGSADSHT